MTEDEELDQRANRRKVLHVKAAQNGASEPGQLAIGLPEGQGGNETQPSWSEAGGTSDPKRNPETHTDTGVTVKTTVLSLQLLLDKCFNASDLRTISEKMELSDLGNKKALVRRIARGFERWLPDDRISGFVESLYNSADWRKMEDLCLETFVSPKGRKRDVFNRLIVLVPEVAIRARLGGRELSLQQFLRKCYDPKGLRNIAAKTELSKTGTQAKLANRIARGFDKWLPEYQAKEFTSLLYKRINKKKMNKACIEQGISTTGRSKDRFDRLIRIVPEIGQRVKEEQKTQFAQ
jgi:hypothetical protein